MHSARMLSQRKVPQCLLHLNRWRNRLFITDSQPPSSSAVRAPSLHAQYNTRPDPTLPVPHNHDLCPLRIRACGEHGHLCRWHLRIGAASGKRYLAPWAAGLVDRLFDDGADRLYCGSPLLFVEQIGAHRTPFSNNGKRTTVSDPLYYFSLPMRNPDAPIFVLISISDCQYVIDKWLGNRTGMLP